jgi:uncharacterized membrane protein YfcA
MDYLAGFVIAVIIAMTGVGAGTISAPLLILLLRVPPELAVGTALAYSAVVKLVAAPVQMFRGQVNYRILAWMLAGGLPGVIVGAVLLRNTAHTANWGPLYWVLGGVIIFSSSWHIYRYLRPAPRVRTPKDRPGWIAALMLLIGAEVGFSSSGAGALGTLALMSLTALPASQIVGTDLAFGLGINLVGGGMHMLGGTYSASLLLHMTAGGIFGAILGSNLAPRVPNKELRLALSTILLLVGVELCLRAASF